MLLSCLLGSCCLEHHNQPLDALSVRLCLLRFKHCMLCSARVKHWVGLTLLGPAVVVERDADVPPPAASGPPSTEVAAPGLNINVNVNSSCSNPSLMMDARLVISLSVGHKKSHHMCQVKGLQPLQMCSTASNFVAQRETIFAPIHGSRYYWPISTGMHLPTQKQKVKGIRNEKRARIQCLPLHQSQSLIS